MNTRSVASTALFLVTIGAAPSRAQTLVDGIVAKVNGDIITQSDVRQARTLKLVPTSDETARSVVDALIDRQLVLAEVARFAPAEPSPDEISAARREWAARLGSGVDVPQVLARAGLSEAGLQSWLRDEVRVRKYLEQRFAIAGADRPAAIGKWIQTLRARAAIDYVIK